MGNLFGLRDTGGHLVGMVSHELLAAAIAIGYAVLLLVISVESGLWLWGLLGALIHYALAGPVLQVTPSLDPDTGEIGGQALALDNERLTASYDTPRNTGNCSSAAVLLVLNRVRATGEAPVGGWAVAMTFGPGLTFYAALLRSSSGD
ncbi:hypothetical protein HDA32_005617 [Spinactinospora alkalitolerans]|uniref:Chalcone/stilbene synthase C-terminal domain-containing protein n=1 Tax=Spinactinospora alkalitolerans TaxID=687207 RepID=A0A852U4G6_9ACTN|nr:3-oxoacyl-[acyl-carrier-protein] synthase III C-terminal domain-containing protein [Spinactinospora alkalitolerans]NYE50497.1 hypothetical protein [Spinactinospora alkalitolerans]